MELIITLIYTALLSFIIINLKFFKTTGLKKSVIASIFIFKVFAGITLILVYTYYYNTRTTADVFNYFDDGNILFKAFKENPVDYFKMLTGIGADSEHLMKYYEEMRFWIKEFDYNLYNDNRTVIRINAFIRLFSFGSIYVHTVFFAFLSFTGLTAIYKVFKDLFTSKKMLLVFAIFFLPSVIFWTSGVLKEAILMFGFGFFLYSFLRLLKYPTQISMYFLFVFSIVILLLSKFYILIAAIPGIFSLLILKTTSHKNRIWKFILIHFILILLLFNSQLFFSNYNFLEILVNKQNDFVTYVESLKYVGSKIEIPILGASAKSILKNTPNALINSFLRPFIWEASSLVSFLAALENLLLVFIIFMSILYRKSNYIMNDLIYFCISFTIILFILSGLTTPVLGALVRYKSPALPFLTIIFLDLIDIKKTPLNFLKFAKN